MKYDTNVVQVVKSRIDIADVVRRYVELRNVGGRLVGVCPFHHETKGSFNVHSDKGFFHCFGCQASGDVIDFYCRINGLDFRDGLEQLAAEAGIQLETVKADPNAARKKKLKQACLEMHALAEQFFRARLAGPEGAGAREYLVRRKVSPELIETFGLGFSPDGWQALQDFLASRGYAPADGVQAGLLSANAQGRTWDRFRGRLIFPIRDVAGKVVAFGGRVMGEGDPKYLNSADSPIYKKGEHLYGLSQARTNISRTRRALLTEGYMDVITLHQFGYTEACAALGTALTPDQVKRLAGFCNRVDLVFDGDPPGRKAAMKAAEMILSHGASCRAVMLPDGEDVDSLLHGQGRQGFEACLDQARDGLEFCMATARSAYSPKEVVSWAKGFLAGLSDLDLRAFFLPRLAFGLGLDETALRESASRASLGQHPAGASAAPSGRSGTDEPWAPRQASGTAGRSGPYPSRGAPLRPRPANGEGLFTPRDSGFLEFAVRYGGIIPELEALGLSGILQNDAARRFWAKLVASGGADVFHELDDAEKAFWAMVQLKEPPPDEVAAKLWEDYRRELASLPKKNKLAELKEAMRQARANGDSLEEIRLAAAYNSLVREG